MQDTGQGEDLLSTRLHSAAGYNYLLSALRARHCSNPHHSPVEDKTPEWSRDFPEVTQYFVAVLSLLSPWRLQEAPGALIALPLP